MITGDSGHGLTHGTLGGRLVTDLIRGTTNPWAPLYDPARVTLRAAGEYLKANLATVRYLTDRMTPGEVASATEIPRGTGAVIRRGLAKVAVYRDEADVLHEHSAVCPHLGCVVHWNPVEHTWDCPCHGSRFTPDGQAINGPATRGLAEVAERRLVRPPAPS
jgi:Rieske Fe-S protein